MKRTIVLLNAAITVISFLSGCSGSGEKVSSAIAMERQQKYKKIAIVCAPKAGISSEYVSEILNQVQPMIPSRLGFLDEAKCIKDASVDTSSPTPVVDFTGKSEYDGIVCLLYSYNNNMVTMDMRMLDNETGQQVWYHQLATKDPDIRDRLKRHGYWTPTTIKMHFYHTK